MTSPRGRDAGTWAERSRTRVADGPSGSSSIEKSVEAAKRGAGRPSSRSARWRQGEPARRLEGRQLLVDLRRLAPPVPVLAPPLADALAGEDVDPLREAEPARQLLR